LGPAAILFVVLVVVAWWLLRAPPAAPEVAGPGLPSAQAAAPAAPPSALELADDDIPIKPAGASTAPTPESAGLMHPHPITPQHERIYAENNLIGGLNAAMDMKNVPELRRLLKQYREEYPEDAHVLQEGYELIANCQEHPGPETRAVAQRYYDEQLDSGLRRYIRRHCLENSN
jgi:hypothetical protein